MNYIEDVNCYCFNPGCVMSIFNTNAFSVVKMSLIVVLTEDLNCSACGSQLVAMPLLEVKMLISVLNDKIAAEV